MMIHGWRRISLLVFAIGLVQAAQASAQQPAQQFAPVMPASTLPQTLPVSTQQVVIPVQYVETAGCESCNGNANGNGYTWRARRCAWLNHFGLDCWAHHDEYGCSSLCSEFRFVFGSCRAFFGERCSPHPPIVPTPPGYSFPPGKWR